MTATYDPRLAIPDYTPPATEPGYLVGFAGAFSAASLGNVGALVNTTGKTTGRLVWDATGRRAMQASGPDADDPWTARNGSASITPAWAEYASIAAGEAAIATGDSYRVTQVYGQGLYEYQRTSTGSNYVRVVLDDAYSAPTGLPARATGLLAEWNADEGRRFDGRVIPNALAAADPTLMVYPLPAGFLDEIGTTPGRQANTADTADPLGGSNALRLTSTAQLQQATILPATVSPVSDTYRAGVWHKTLSGATNWALGTTSGAAIAAGAGWARTAGTLTLASNNGVSSGSGNTNGVAAFFGLGVFDSFAGETLPGATLDTLDDLIADQSAGHLRMPFAARGSLDISDDGVWTLNGANGGAVIAFDPDGLTSSAFSFGVWFKVDTLPTSTYGNVIGFDNNAPDGLTGTAATNAAGELRIQGALANTGNEGYVTVNPRLSASTAALAHNVIGQGWQCYGFTVDGTGLFTAYMNGVPMKLGTQAGWGARSFARLVMGAYAATTALRKTTQPLEAQFQNFWFATSAQTAAQWLQQMLRGKARIEALGHVVRFDELIIADGDSLHANVEMWIRRTAENQAFDPHLHILNMAQGGTDIVGNGTNGWSDAPRLADVIAAVDAGLQVYRKVRVIYHGDIPARWHDDGGWTDWRSDFAALPPLLRARSAADPGRVNVGLCTFIPRPGLDDDLQTEVWRMEANADIRANWATSWGLDFYVDAGLGTERVNAAGTVYTAETIAGGTMAGDWRSAMATTRVYKGGSGSLTLSATSGATITATATAGFFTADCVGQHLHAQVSAASFGRGRIVAVAGDGSSCTVDTTGNTAANQTFPATSFASAANWWVHKIRSPGQTITLSAASGSSFTATAVAGTFNQLDVYREITAGSGDARITAVNGDGSVATLTTTNVTPNAWSGEGAATIARDTISYVAFGATSYAAGAWSVSPGQGIYNQEGVHPLHPGGRMIADARRADVQGWIDAIGDRSASVAATDSGAFTAAIAAAVEQPGITATLAATDDGAFTVAASASAAQPAHGIVTARSAGKSGNTNVTSHAITLPAATAGQRIVVAFATDGAPTVTVDTGVSGTGWSSLGSTAAGAIANLELFTQVATGSDALTLNTSAAEMTAHMAWAISNAGTISAAFANSGGAGSANADPPNLNMGSSASTLWLAVAGFDAQTIPSAAPSGYGEFRTEQHGSVNGASMGAAELTATATAENPGTFTSAAEQWGAATIGVRA